MPRSPKWPPTVRRHHTGQAYVRIGGKDFYLGKYGSTKAHEAYLRLLEECKPGQPPPAKAGAAITVAELCARYLDYLRDQPRPGGDSKSCEAQETAYALRPLIERYGSTLAAEFGVRGLKAVRQAMRESGLAATVVNHRIGRVKRAWRWAAEEELVPGTVWHALQALRGLPCRAARPKPVPADQIEATLTHLHRLVADMVRVQWLTGMRPGEVVRMRPCDLDRARDVWVYQPPQHKTSHKGIERRILIGPRAQAILLRYLDCAADAYLFCPDRHLHHGGARYTTISYSRAVTRACEHAGVKWHVHQLRHSAATLFREVGGLDATQALLGHQSSQMTEVYADLPSGAVDVIRRVG